VLWLVEDAAGDDRRGRRLEGLGGRTKLLPYLENQSTITLRERQSRRPNHADELQQPAIGRSLTAKVTAKWLRASYAESRFGADELVANDHEPAVHMDHDELLAAKGHSATTVKVTYQHAERVALLEAFDGHEFMLDSA